MKQREIQKLEDKLIFDFISDFLNSDPDYELLSKAEQEKTFAVYKTLITAVYRSQFHENVYPIVYAKDNNTKKLLVEAMASIAHIVPDVTKVTVALVN